MLLIVLVLANVHAPVLPLVLAFTMHLVVQPLSLVLSAITPNICTEPIDLIVLPTANEIASVLPRVLTLSVLLAFCIIALVSATIHPSLRSLTVLVVVEPLTFVFGSVVMLVCSISTSLIVFPISIVDIAIDVCKLAYVNGEVPLPLALPAAHSPSYLAPSGHTCTPWPQRMLPRHSPW